MKEELNLLILSGVLYVAHQVTPGDWMFATVSILMSVSVIIGGLIAAFVRKKK